jgi:hypothetical protein
MFIKVARSEGPHGGRAADSCDAVPSNDPTNLSVQPSLRLTILSPMDLGGDAMDHDAIAIAKLKEEMRLRHQRYAAAPKAPNDAMIPRIKMIVSEWYTDELGNRARVIHAHEK